MHRDYNEKFAQLILIKPGIIFHTSSYRKYKKSPQISYEN